MKVLDEINLSGLRPKERTAVQQMLIEEADIFSVDDSDIENITSASMNINFSDNTHQYNLTIIQCLENLESRHLTAFVTPWGFYE